MMTAVAALLLALANAIFVQAPNEKLSLEIADTQATREYGLMYRSGLAPHAGMIFVFAGDSHQTFWMKNTLIPLDMIFVRADGTIDSIDPDVPAQTDRVSGETILRAGYGKYVIELAAGEAHKAGLYKGEHLSIPKMEPHDSGAS
jgi:uncharacterized protein